MNGFLFLPYYFKWHYSRGIIDLYHNLLRMLGFFLSWFSVGHLLKTFFAPWKRLGEDYHVGFHPEEFFSALLVNTLMRLLGMAVRLCVIGTGLVVYVFGIIASVAIMIVWIGMPVIIAFFVAIIIQKIS